MTVTDVYDALIEAVATAVTDLEALGMPNDRAKAAVVQYVTDMVDTFEDDEDDDEEAPSDYSEQNSAMWL